MSNYVLVQKLLIGQAVDNLGLRCHRDNSSICKFADIVLSNLTKATREVAENSRGVAFTWRRLSNEFIDTFCDGRVRCDAEFLVPEVSILTRERERYY